METQGLSMDDAIFCGCAGAFVLVNLIVYCHEAPVLCRIWYGKVKSLRWRRWRDWYPTISRNDQIREAFLYRETCARKVVWARRCMSYAIPLPACGLVPVLYNIWAGNERWMSVGFSWSLLLTYISLLTVHLMPSLVTASVLDFICLVAHGLMAFWLSPLGSPNFDDVFILQLVCFMMVQTVAVSIAAHYTGVLLSQGLVVGVVVWRMFAETDFAAGPDTVANPRTLVLCNIFCTGAVVAIHNVANRLIRHTVETAMRASDSNRHLSAASALLELTCEAVCELDSDLKLQLHSQKLATMLLRRSGVSLEGRKLTDFISPGEAERAQEILMSQSDRAAHAFHTHLVDSYSSKFRTEVFQVKYAMMDGRECHLVGLRDFTDLKSLAGENATDAIQDESELAADAAASAESHGREVHVLDVPERSCELPPGLDYWDNSSESDRSNATLERNERENGIVEKRLKYAHKDALLEIDMDAEMVEAASAPFCSLAGKSVSQSFASDFTRELLHRLREDAIQFNAQRKSQDFQVPDQVATFKATPIYVDRSITMASGVMKVSLTRYGGLKVIMCINHSEVQNTMTNALHSFTSKSPEDPEGTGMSPLSL